MVFILVKILSLKMLTREEIFTHERNTVVHFRPTVYQSNLCACDCCNTFMCKVLWYLYFLLTTISPLLVALKKPQPFKTDENQTAEYGKSWKVYCLSTNFLANEILYLSLDFSDKGCESSKRHDVNLFLCQLLQWKWDTVVLQPPSTLGTVKSCAGRRRRCAQHHWLECAHQLLKAALPSSGAFFLLWGAVRQGCLLPTLIESRARAYGDTV